MSGITPNTQQHWTLFLLAAWEEDDETAEHNPMASELWEYDQGDNLFSDAGDTVFVSSQSVSTTLSNLHSDGYADRSDASDRSTTHTAYDYKLSKEGREVLQNELGRPKEKPQRRGKKQPQTTMVASTASETASSSAPADTVNVDVENMLDEESDTEPLSEDEESVVTFEQAVAEVKQNTLRHWTLYLIDALSGPTPNEGMTRFDLFNAQNPNADIYKASDSMSPTISTLIELNLLEEVGSRERYTAYDSTELGERVLEEHGAPTQKQNRYTVENFTREIPAGKSPVEFYVEGDGSEIEEPVSYRTINLGEDSEEETEVDEAEAEAEAEEGTTIVSEEGFTVDVDLTSETLIDALNNVGEETVADILGSEMTEGQASQAITTVIESVANNDN